MKISPARRATYDILYRIEADRAFSSVLLPAFEEELTAADRGLCHELVLGVLRKQLYLDRLIDDLAKSKKLDLAVRIALRLGIYQLMFLDRVPVYSAINESVNLVQRAKKTSAKGLVNAVLRRASTGTPVPEFKNELDRISIETSHPIWLLEKWISEFGGPDAKRIATANNEIPRASFRFLEEQAHAEYPQSDVVASGFVAPAVDSRLRELADNGKIYFQDEASQLVASVAARTAGTRFLDVCAAPGGKTTQIAGARGGFVVAGDLHRSRVDLLTAMCTRLHSGSVAILQYDAEVGLPFADRSFDTVLVDAPCSGTGTIRRNPEIRYFLAREDFDELSGKQLKILINASKVVSSGGRLIYSTCSLEREENEVVCRQFLESSSDFNQISPVVPERFRTIDGFARTFPHRDGTDGFFIAEFYRS